VSVILNVEQDVKVCDLIIKWCRRVKYTCILFKFEILIAFLFPYCTGFLSDMHCLLLNLVYCFCYSLDYWICQ